VVGVVVVDEDGDGGEEIAGVVAGVVARVIYRVIAGASLEVVVVG